MHAYQYPEVGKLWSYLVKFDHGWVTVHESSSRVHMCILICVSLMYVYVRKSILL